MMLGQHARTTMGQRWPNIVMLSGSKVQNTKFHRQRLHWSKKVSKHSELGEMLVHQEVNTPSLRMQ